MANLLGIYEITKDSIQLAFNIGGIFCGADALKNANLCTGDAKAAFILLQASHVNRVCIDRPKIERSNTEHNHCWWKNSFSNFI